jgi:glycosyltransferase involved in cell wall biosynthesis
MLEAADQLVAEGSPFMLVLVGNSPLRTEIETMITRLGLQDHVKIFNWASNSEVQQHILASQAMVLPSFAPGLPVVVMEALVLSPPVISTYVTGIPDLVEPGIYSWLVPPASVETLTNACNHVIG